MEENNRDKYQVFHWDIKRHKWGRVRLCLFDTWDEASDKARELHETKKGTYKILALPPSEWKAHREKSVRPQFITGFTKRFR